MSESPIEKKPAKRGKKKEVALPSDTEFRDQIAMLYSSMRELQTQLSALQADPYIAALPDLRDVKAQETKRIFVSTARMCERNGVDTANLYSFIARVVRDFGFCAVDAGLKTAEEFCKEGRPDGMIYAGAKKYHDEYGRHDAAFLDATLFLRSGQEYKAPKKTASDENFVEKLARRYTDRAVKSLTRYEFYQLVRNFCISKPELFKPELVLNFFKERVATDPDISRRILGPDDVPHIEFELLKGETNGN